MKHLFEGRNRFLYIFMSEKLNLDQLLEIVKSRIDEGDEKSYSYKIINEGLEKITRKIGEEALEVVIGSFVLNQKRDEKSKAELTGEICDLFYHILLLMASQDIDLDLVYQELAKRNNQS